MQTEIKSIEVKEYSDGKTEFKLTLSGKVQCCRLDYGTRGGEKIDLPENCEHPVIYGEHAFPSGTHRICARVINGNQVTARKIVMYTKT